MKSKEETPFNSGAAGPVKTAVAIGGVGVAAVLGWIAYSAMGVDHAMPLSPALDGELHEFTTGGPGTVAMYVDERGQGSPIVLLHSINGAASAFEMRPLFHKFAGKRPVYAPDLPGFGFSERGERVYSAALYVSAIITLLEQLGGRAHVVALSLTSEFAAAAAKARPELFRSLTMISPTGFSLPQTTTVQSALRRNTGDPLYRFFTFPLWSQALFDLLVTRPCVRYFLQRQFVGPVDEALVDYAYATAHQKGARHAPYYFVSGKLFTPDVRSAVYETLKLPVLVLFDRDPNVGLDLLSATLSRCANWRAVRIAPTLGLPHFEKLAETSQALDAFWQGTEAN